MAEATYSREAGADARPTDGAPAGEGPWLPAGARAAFLLVGFSYLVMLAFLMANSFRMDAAQPPVGRGTESVMVGASADFLLDFGQIRSGDALFEPDTQARFSPARNQMPVFGMHYFDDGVLWLRFRAPAIGSGDKQRTIRISDPRVRWAKLYVTKAGRTTEHEWTYDDPLRRAGIGSRVPAFHFDAAELEGADIQVGYASLSVLRGLVYVESRRAFEALSLRQVVLPSVLSGALCALGIYLLVIGALLRRWPFLAASAMAFALTTIIFGGPGLFHTVMLPSAPSLADFIAYVPKPLALSAWLVFLIVYLDLPRKARRTGIVLLGIAAIVPFQTVVAAFKVGLDVDLPVQITSSIPLLTGMLAGLFVLLRFAISGDRRARLFLLCWSPLLIGTIVRSIIIMFPTPGGAKFLSQDPFVDIVLSMIALAVAMVFDIQGRETTLRRRAEANEQRFRQFAAIASDSFFETDEEGRVATASGEAAKVLGIRPGEPLAAALSAHGIPQPAVPGVAGGGRRGFQAVEIAVETADGRRRWFDVSATPWQEPSGAYGGFRGAIVEVTGHVERRIRENEQTTLVAMGQLAGGIAHEVNNLLHPIVNLARRVRERHVSDPEGRRILDIVVDSGMRAGEVVGGVLDSVAPKRRRGNVLPAGLAVERAVSAVAATLPPDIRLDRQVGNMTALELPFGEVLQVVGNLVSNAARASAPGGSVSVVLEETGGRATLRVVDRGCGMEEGLRRTALQPFVTSAEGGTGLGLAAVSSLVRGWGARLELESEPGKGTTVTIAFPPGDEGAEHGEDGTDANPGGR